MTYLVDCSSDLWSAIYVKHQLLIADRMDARRARRTGPNSDENFRIWIETLNEVLGVKIECYTRNWDERNKLTVKPTTTVLAFESEEAALAVYLASLGKRYHSEL